MTISDQITRLNNAKAAIKTSIENKGVTVSSTAKLDEYATLIDSIQVGSGSGGGETYEHPDFYEFRTANGTNYRGLFFYCNETELDLTSFDTSKVKDMSNMFHYCFLLKQINLSNFNTSNVTTMTYMFNSCSTIASIDVSSFDTSQVKDMSYMFNNCGSLTSLDLSNFDTSNVTNMTYMFYSCRSLTSLDLSSFDTSNVTNMSAMFNECSSLTELDLSSFNTSNVTNMSSIFNGCKLLASLDLSNWDVGKVTSVSSAFYNCTALTDFKAPKNINATFDFSRCPNLTHDSLMSIINNLVTVTSTKKLTLGATNLAKLTDEEKAIAVNRGWTLA